MVYGDFKDLPRRTTADKILGDKAFNKFINFLLKRPLMQTEEQELIIN